MRMSRPYVMDAVDNMMNDYQIGQIGSVDDDIFSLISGGRLHIT